MHVAIYNAVPLPNCSHYCAQKVAVSNWTAFVSLKYKSSVYSSLLIEHYYLHLGECCSLILLYTEVPSNSLSHMSIHDLYRPASLMHVAGDLQFKPPPPPLPHRCNLFYCIEQEKSFQTNKRTSFVIKNKTKFILKLV